MVGPAVSAENSVLLLSELGPLAGTGPWRDLSSSNEQEERYGQFAHRCRRDHKSTATGRSPHLNIRSLLRACPWLRRFRRVPELCRIPVRDVSAAWNLVDRLQHGHAIAVTIGSANGRRLYFGRTGCRDRSL